MMKIAFFDAQDIVFTLFVMQCLTFYARVTVHAKKKKYISQRDAFVSIIINTALMHAFGYNNNKLPARDNGKRSKTVSQELPEVQSP